MLIFLSCDYIDFVLFMSTVLHRFCWNFNFNCNFSTVAEKDTAAAAKAAVGRLKAALGRQRAAHRLRLAAAAQLRPPICLKIVSLAYDKGNVGKTGKVSNFGSIGDGSDKGNARKVGKTGKVSNFGAIGNRSDMIKLVILGCL